MGDELGGEGVGVEVNVVQPRSDGDGAKRMLGTTRGGERGREAAKECGCVVDSQQGA